MLSLSQLIDSVFMPQNLEHDFQKAVLKLKHKKKNVLKRRIQNFFKLIIQHWFISLLLLVAVINVTNTHLIKDLTGRLVYSPEHL
jgi:hypothetical protein